jgi:NAD(P) transhydrogenase subunit alpha
MFTGALTHLGTLADATQAQEGGAGSTSGLTILFLMIVIFILAVFLGVQTIGKVPTMLHTPLMSGTNAIHGVVLVGAMLVLAVAGNNVVLLVLGFIAVVFAGGNVVGGFVVTDRMLQMFKKKPEPGGKK